MRGRAFLAFFYGFMATLFTLLAVGVEQWTGVSNNSIGLFGVVQGGIFTPFLGYTLTRKAFVLLVFFFLFFFLSTFKRDFSNTTRPAQLPQLFSLLELFRF